MNMRLTVIQVTKNQVRAQVTLTEKKDGKPDPMGAAMTVIFKTPKDGDSLQVGTEYNISFTPIKK